MWINVDNGGYIYFGYHKSGSGGKKSKIMCIISSTVEMAWIKDFFYNMCKKWSKKVDIFADNPQVIHKLYTKCG